jgi:hypothetical protein
MATSHSIQRRANARHESFLKHAGYRYAWAAGILSVACILAYLAVDITPRHNGGSWLGYTLGSVSAALIVWLTLLGLRKRAITDGAWSLKGWTSAHVYLGVSLIVIATLHTGFQFGWNVHTLAYGLMMAVILSGLIGVAMYATLPKRMSSNRGETSSKEMVEAIAAIDRELRAAAQPLPDAFSALIQDAIEKTELLRGPLARFTTQPTSCPTRRALLALRAEIEGDADPDDTFGPVVSLLERKRALLLRVRRYARYKALLELWLYVHVPCTFALIAALIAHIFSVFYFW